MPDRTESPPYSGYAAIMGTFAGLLGTAGVLSRAFGRDPQCNTALDFAVLAAATFKAARTLARDQVASFVREPFVEGEAYKGDDEEPVQNGGMQQAIGELVTCTRCVGTWVAAGLASTQILAPRTGRLLTSVLAAGAINDWLHAGFTAVTAKCNELEQRNGV